ncbi:arsenate reductase (glutaredoxin) [Pseudooceanicola sp.]|uniref:arsenate reductase (glutaredoxin) n=1 Tax=Pseudooceanicola sp. TaxID=1914328 RepID=UPI00260B8123|nr:arsenate reductase (glutaredoxin) [Pseudooceanicola sp.]MDF1853941.1 arsenate reductase (glutaredoxin) [Pseudooceanicola sp.]
MKVEIWHNPRCSKSRQTLALLQDRGITPEVRLYLENPPTQDELQTALQMLGLTPSQVLRRGEPEFKSLNLKTADDATILAAMAEHPKLIERPVVFVGAKAALGRPPENVLALL